MIDYGDSTRSVKAVSCAASPGLPVPPSPVLAAAYHLSAEESSGDGSALDTYGRSSNPTWRQLESALAQLEGADSALAFGSGMAAITAALRVLATPGSVLWCQPTAITRCATTHEKALRLWA